MLGGVALAGMLGALLAGMVAGLERKRRALATLGLLGCEGRSLTLFPLAQALAIAALGAAVSLALYEGAALIVNAWFSPSLRPGQAAARLGAGQLALVLAGALVIPLLPALLVGRKAARIEPSEALREI